MNIATGFEITLNEDIVQNLVSVSIWVAPDWQYRSVEHKFSAVLYLPSECAVQVCRAQVFGGLVFAFIFCHSWVIM